MAPAAPAGASPGEVPGPSRGSSPGAILATAVSTRFLQWCVVGLVIPISNLLRLSKGLDLAQLGFSAAVVSAVVVLLELPTGVLADGIGRKRTYLAAVGFQIAAYAALLFSSGFIAVSAAFGLYGVSRALSSGSLEALLVDRYIEAAGTDKLHRLMSATNVADTAGLALGSVAGGFIPTAWAALAPASNRYHGNLFAMILLSCALGAVVVFAVTEGSRDKAGTKRLGSFISESLAFIASSRRFLAFMAAAVAWGLAFSAIETYWQPRVASLAGTGASDELNGFLSAGYFIAATLGGAIAAPLMAKSGKRLGWLIGAFRLLTAAFVALLALQSTRAGFAAFYLSMFLWNGVASPAEATLLNGFLPPDKRSSMLSAVSLAVQLGGFAGAIAFGLVVGSFGIVPAWLAAAAVLGGSAALFLGMRPEGHAREVGHRD